MHLTHILIKNFRAIDHIEVDFEDAINVIVGPNAIGKTTIMEAIRLSKALLAPRSGSEQTQVLHSLGASSPHIPQRLFMDVLARDPSSPITIATSYKLHDDEIAFLKMNEKAFASTLVQNRLGQFFSTPTAIIQHLSSAEGQEQLAEAEQALAEAVKTATTNRGWELVLTIDAQTQRIAGNDALGQLLLAALDQRLPPYQSIFSYFPADRAFPAGEQPIQIGSQDTPTQIESHNSQPQLKFARIKHTIITSLVQDEDSRAALEADFRLIFAKLLTGRSFASIGIRPELGLVSIKVRDDNTGAIFDLDGMSAGEKGVIMTFLLIARSIAEHGMILFDEPELHLNPAVCRDILGFMLENYVKPKNMQAILCTHSPELLSSALDMPDCALLHLRSPSLITPVRPRDTDEVAAALRLLGASELDNLMYRGLLFVEGDDDVGVLQAGFPDRLARYKVSQLGGRGEVEKYVVQLQSAEAGGADLVRTGLIFDLDRQPTSLRSSKQVRITQWDRTCLENYFLDANVLTDFLKSSEYVINPVSNVGEVKRLLKELALRQVNVLAARDTFAALKYAGVGARSADLEGGEIPDIADRLYNRVSEAQSCFGGVDLLTWRSGFIQNAEKRAADLRAQWDMNWPKLCNGKQLFTALQKSQGIKMNLRKFKKIVIQEMRLRETADYRAMDHLLQSILA
jgi:predicted ATPase